MTITARHYDNAADIIFSAHAVRMRLMNPTNAFKIVRALPAPAEPAPDVVRPLWATQDLRFDHHMGIWKRQLNRFGHPKYVAYIRRRCAEAEVSYETIVGKAKYRRATTVRQDIMLGLRTDFNPPPSYAQIGRLMGGRDHSSVVHGANAAAARAALPRPVYRTHIEALYGDKELAAAVRSDYLIGLTFDALGDKYRLGHDTIRRFTKEMGWKRDPRSSYVKAGETPKATQKKIVDLYRKGLSIQDISQQCGVAVRTVGHIRRKLGIAVRPR